MLSSYKFNEANAVAVSNLIHENALKEYGCKLEAAGFCIGDEMFSSCELTRILLTFGPEQHWFSGTSASDTEVCNSSAKPKGDIQTCQSDSNLYGRSSITGQETTTHKKRSGSPRQGTSQFRGVTKHRTTGRFEAHFWDAAAPRPATSSKQGRKRGRQVYLGGFENEEAAARAYDQAVLRFCDCKTKLNFPASDYADEIETLMAMSREEVVAKIRRASRSFSRGRSNFRGVTSTSECLMRKKKLHGHMTRQQLH
mmetsp:Transcript_22081/g.52792  ORF Transcript_22081/g.52792 Transcript_22081/m.52792 type:complete len:254 (-) Transcript_22081:842-1603(-)